MKTLDIDTILGQDGTPHPDIAVFQTVESVVRSYCRGWPAVFDHAQGSYLYDEHGRAYLDLFAGAGALNYGHNNPLFKHALLDYLERDGVIHSLDMFTAAKRDFLRTFHNLVLRPRGLDHKVMFPGPAGTNAVEAALKLARKVTGRATVAFCTNGFHGMTLGALAITGNASSRAGAGLSLTNSTPIPFGGGKEQPASDLGWFERMLTNPGSGLDTPAAVIVETVQGEGGINIARGDWLRDLSDLCRRHGMLLIVDDIQMGCGRTGGFFSFEEAGIIPDIITLSKSISGYGLPMALTLIKPELDVWEPGEHNGTFRGHNPAFVTATAAISTYWADTQLEKQTRSHGEHVDTALRQIANRQVQARHRGRGLVWGLEFTDTNRAARVCRCAFQHGLLLETCGPRSEVVKLLPPLTITENELETSLNILARAVRETD